MLSQILALIIAIVLFSALLQGKYPRYLLTLAAGGAMVLVVLLGTMGSPAAALEALSVDSFVKPQFWFAHGGVTEFNVGINWSTILFLAGMMIMVEAMSEAGFFDWVCLRLAKALGFRPMPLMLSFMVLAALLSMFVDSITVVLFLVVATARLAHFLRRLGHFLAKLYGLIFHAIDFIQRGDSIDEILLDQLILRGEIFLFTQCVQLALNICFRRQFTTLLRPRKCR